MVETLQKNPRIPLAKSGEEVLAFLMGYSDDYGYMPTQAEIATYMGKRRARTYSVSWVKYILEYLEGMGRISVASHKLRGIVIIPSS